MSGKIYEEPLSICAFLEGDKANKIITSALNLAKMFHDEHGMCPVVQQSKFDLYSIDYYFLVFAIVNYVRTVEFAEDEETGEYFAQKIIGDFVTNPTKKSMQLLINAFDYKNILYANKDRKWVFTLQRFATHDKKKRFFFSGITFSIDFIEKLNDSGLKLLKEMSSKENFVLEKTGPKCFYKDDTLKPDEVVFSFKALL